jgi:hypothetical protein
MRVKRRIYNRAKNEKKLESTTIASIKAQLLNLNENYFSIYLNRL